MHLYGVSFREPHGRIALDPDLLSLACTAVRRLGAAEAYARALFRAVCVERAAEAGLDRAAFTDALDHAGTRAECVRRADVRVRRPAVLGQRPPAAASSCPAASPLGRAASGRMTSAMDGRRGPWYRIGNAE